jgi:hypothetical protein
MMERAMIIAPIPWKDAESQEVFPNGKTRIKAIAKAV